MRARDGMLNRRRREEPPQSGRFHIEVAIMLTVFQPHRPFVDFFNARGAGEFVVFGPSLRIIGKQGMNLLFSALLRIYSSGIYAS